MSCAASSRGSWAALPFLLMFSYGAGSNPQIDYVRLLISDTQAASHVFEDSEILAFAAITSQVWQSSMQYSGTLGVATLPTSPVNYLRTAALALDSLAANSSRLGGVIQILDVKLSVDKSAIALRDQAAQYRQVDDDNMAFVIIEQVQDEWSFRDRFWAQVQRTSSV